MWWNPATDDWESVVVQLQDHVPRAPEASASSSGSMTDKAIAARGIVEVLNIRACDGPPPGLPCTVIPVGDIIGRLNHYDRNFNPIDVKPFRQCCGANGRIQLHLATKPQFQDVAKLVKSQVRSYWDFLRTGGVPYVLRLTSCGCTPVSHIS